MRVPEILSRPANRLTHKIINSGLFYQLIAWGVPQLIGSGLSKDPTDRNVLKAVNRIERVARLVIPNDQDRVLESSVTSRLKREFRHAIEVGEDTNLTKTVKRTFTLMGPKYLKTILVDFGVMNFGVGKLNQRLKPSESHIEALALQPNSECNAKPRCLGCFAGRNQGKLDDETLDRILRQSIELTSRYTIIAGGEPLLEKDRLLKLFAKYPRMPFLISTNGKLLDEAYAKEVADLGNVLTLINIPGLESTAKALRKDPDVWNDICRAAENLQKYGAASGFASTVYRANFREISSSEFVNQMIDFNMMLGFYFGYTDPVGCSPRKELALKPEMNDEFSGRVRDLSADYPFILINTIGGEHKIGGCPMVPQSDNSLNVHQKSLREILTDPYFELIHNKRPLCLREPNFLAELQKVSTTKQ